MSRPTREERATFLEEAKLVAGNPCIVPGIDALASKEVRRIARHCTALADDLAEARALLTAICADIDNEQLEHVGISEPPSALAARAFLERTK